MIVKENGKYYLLTDNKKYLITEIDGDEFYYRDENGIEHAVSLHNIKIDG